MRWLYIKKIAVLFGGKSTEHDVSKVSGTSVLCNLDKSKYDIYPIYISKDGLFYKYNVKEFKILTFDEEINNTELIKNIFDYLKNIDVIFPVLHGLYGEDGTVQGLLELLGKPYVGCKVLSSSLCMDKVYTKTILRSCGIEQAKSMYVKKYNNDYIFVDENFNRSIYTLEELLKKVKEYLMFPVFIKPSNSGSSVGVSRCVNGSTFINCLSEAFKYDGKVLIEEEIVGRELECAVLGNDDPLISDVGEVLTSGDFYSFDSKYKNIESKTIIPALIDNNLKKKLQNIALKAYLACDCKSLSRIDFFIENKTNRIILNEINTMPGFTEISMYPKLIENVGISYSELLDKLIELV